MIPYGDGVSTGGDAWVQRVGTALGTALHPPRRGKRREAPRGRRRGATEYCKPWVSEQEMEKPLRHSSFSALPTDPPEKPGFLAKFWKSPIKGRFSACLGHDGPPRGQGWLRLASLRLLGGPGAQIDGKKRIIMVIFREFPDVFLEFSVQCRSGSLGEP